MHVAACGLVDGRGHILRQRVGEIAHRAGIDAHAVHAVALVVVHGRDGAVNRNFAEVWSAEAGELRVLIRENAPLQKRVVAQVDAGYEIGRAESHLLRFGKEIVHISVERHLTDDLDWNQFLGPELRRVEYVKIKIELLIFLDHLHAEFKLGVIALFDGIP
ncbi:hypothetical protein SDC9_115412 [bioreactor metagenome]|uniref:Uncharacterized protein n=1 Tax=bioreactor metagenome TaxID=1076179 RepID=A0A645BST0_9ZZZZ